ncbi:MAG TPA: hypothetical protein VKW08_00425 [Xanthobacteraceae bacterium]|nr:hypothetical protein [Xanthobacteraceae bacterium]
MFKVDQHTFTEIKSALDEEPSTDSRIIYDYGIQRPTLNIIKKYDNFADYEAHFNTADEDDDDREDDDEQTSDAQPQELKPQQKGFLRGQLIPVAPQILDADSALRVSIRGLWKIIGLLEQRKVELERQIKNMERYLQQGIELVEIHVEK